MDLARTMTFYTYHDSPVGQLLLAGMPGTLMIINFPQNNQAVAPQEEWKRDDAVFKKTTRQLDEYFSGTRTEFTIPLELEGSDFQKKVWAVLQAIPFGTTISYGDVAQRIGQPSASRAVGSANNANPIPIIIPCHRVIGADKSMTGFGGGIDIKIKLLELENRLSSHSKPQGDLFYPDNAVTING